MPGDDRYAVTEEQAGWRVDRFVRSVRPSWSRRDVDRLLREGGVRVEVDGRRRRPKKGARLEAGWVVWIPLLDDPVADPTVTLREVFVSDDWIVVDKDAGVPCAPLRPGETGSVVNGLLHRYPELRGVGFGARESGLCHRLDNETSGLLLVARHDHAFAAARRAFEGGIDKRYLAVCDDPDGALPSTGTCGHALRSAGPRVEIAEEGWPAETHWQVLERHGGRVLVEARAARAFRHQVRVHLAAVGAPLVGDAHYGRRGSLTRHALHASHLAFGALAVSSPLPAELRELLG